MSDTPNENTTTMPAADSPVAAARAARLNEAQASLEARKAELARAQADLELQELELHRKATEPRDPHALGLRARDAIMDMLAHQVDTTGAASPQRAAWEALAAFIDATL